MSEEHGEVMKGEVVNDLEGGCKDQPVFVGMALIIRVGLHEQSALMEELGLRSG